MPAEPVEWNIVVVGAWNRAILTPDGIRRLLFQIPDGTPIEVLFAIDKPGVYRVSNDGLIVEPSSGRLLIDAAQATEDSLLRAATVCTRAIQALPATPITAVGVNIRYRFGEIPNHMIDLISAPADTALSDAGFQIVESSLSRTVPQDSGVVNMKVSKLRDGSAKMEFNFHLGSTNPDDLIAWLARTPDFLQLSDRLSGVLGVQNVRQPINA